jgi:hypothetical protein
MMMNHEVANPFDSIESAHEFVTLLAETVLEAKRDVEADVQRESRSNFPRRLQALRMTLYSLEKLEFHMSRSHRILNDLRSLRRLLFQERTSDTATAGAEPNPIRTRKNREDR